MDWLVLQDVLTTLQWWLFKHQLYIRLCLNICIHNLSNIQHKQLLLKQSIYHLWLKCKIASLCLADTRAWLYGFPSPTSVRFGSTLRYTLYLNNRPMRLSNLRTVEFLILNVYALFGFYHAISIDQVWSSLHVFGIAILLSLVTAQQKAVRMTRRRMAMSNQLTSPGEVHWSNVCKRRKVIITLTYSKYLTLRGTCSVCLFVCSGQCTCSVHSHSST